MSASPSPDLRPLAIGELIDRAALVWRTQFGTLFRLYIGFQLATYILTKLWELAARLWFPLVRGGAQTVDVLQQRPMEAAIQYAGGFGLLLVVMSTTMWLSWVVGVAGSAFAIRRQLGEPISLGEAFAVTRRKLGTTTVAFILSSLWGVGVGLLSMIPGLGLVIVGAIAVSGSGGSQATVVLTSIVGTFVALGGMLLAVLWWMLRFLLTAQVIAMEEVGALGALKRSGALISGRVGAGFLNLVKVRATLLLTLVFVILFAVGLVAGMPSMILQFIYANPLDPMNANPDAIPQALMIPAQLLQVVATAVFSPLWLVVGALFYLDMRVRREGLDLELQLSRERRAE